MNLADKSTILEIQSLRTSRRRGQDGNIKSCPGYRQKQRCSCGHCSVCCDNERWERIFNEKFADPDYYKERPLQQGSSLGWLKRPR
jgi:hypothetical protein